MSTLSQETGNVQTTASYDNAIPASYGMEMDRHRSLAAGGQCSHPQSAYHSYSASSQNTNYDVEAYRIEDQSVGKVPMKRRAQNRARQVDPAFFLFLTITKSTSLP